MKVYTITKADLNSDNEYIGKLDLSDLDGHLEADESLGYVRFAKSLVVKGYIYFKAGSGIKAGWGIEAGEGIEAGWGIEAGSGIKAGEGIKAGWGIEAGSGIKAGEGIKAGWGIEAGEGIKAGSGIEAGEGIKAGLYITCKTLLIVSVAVFAGICYWREPSQDEMTITCGKFQGGKVKYGILKELGMEEEKASNAKMKAKELEDEAQKLLEKAKELRNCL